MGRKMQTTTVDFFGQACTSIRSSGIDIVSDPWFSDRAHLRAWVPFPTWSTEQLRAIHQRIDAATHIYLSHHHEDHFDPEFLRSLSRKTILVGNFWNDKMQRALRDLSTIHEIRRINHMQEVSLSPEISVQAILQQPKFRTDSMLLIKTPESVILNANDCGLDSEALKTISERNRVTVFMYTLNFMASGYPISYLRSDDPDFSKHMDILRTETVGLFRFAMQQLKPELAVAFAGPVMFHDKINAHLNSYPESVDWTRMVEEVAPAGDVIWPAPFSRIVCEQHRVVSRDVQLWPSPDTPQRSLGEEEIVGLPPTQDEILTAAQSFVAMVNGILSEIDAKVTTQLGLSAVSSVAGLESEEPLWHMRIRFDNPDPVCEFVDVATAAAAPCVHITTTPQILHLLLSGDITVDDLLLSAKARFRRDPDSFNSTLHNIMRFGGDASSGRALVQWMKRMEGIGQSILVQYKDKTFQIPKYCPHEGESLEAAIITKDGNIICPRHKWTFCLADGACLAGDKGINLYDSLKGNQTAS